MSQKAFLLFVTFCWTEMAWGVPITFNTALPVAEDEFIAREQLVYNQSGNDPGTADRDRTAWAAVSVWGTALTATLPYSALSPTSTGI